MPKISGAFAQFSNLDQIPVEDFIKWSKSILHPIALQNFIANRILYPQVVPITLDDLRLDMAILREALKDKKFINKDTKKIVIPIEFIDRFPDLAQLVLAFVDAYLSETREGSLWKVVLKDENEQSLGTIIIPDVISRGGSLEVGLENKIYEIKLGSLAILPCLKNHCRLIFKIKDGTFLGKEVGKVDVFGGKLGVVVDGRLK